jgi:hypothetical protein
VEDQVIGVPRQVFARSPIFNDMFTLPVAAQTVPEGVQKDHPLRLEGIKMSEFRSFVRAAVASECVVVL